MAAKGTYTHDEILKMDPEVQAFLSYWVQKIQADQFNTLGRLLGVLYTAGEIREWGKQSGEKGSYQDADPVNMPLTMALRPELREGLVRLVGGLTLSKDIKVGQNEMVLDLGRTSIQDFKEFVETHRQAKPSEKPPTSFTQ